MVELHDVVRTGLYATGPAHDAPFSFLNGHVFRKSRLNFVKVIDARLRLQTEHLGAGGRIVDLF